MFRRMKTLGTFPQGGHGVRHDKRTHATDLAIRGHWRVEASSIHLHTFRCERHVDLKVQPLAARYT